MRFTPPMRYAGVGAIATAVHYTLLVGVVEGLAWPAWLGAGIGAVVGAQIGYGLNRRFTFGHRGAWRRSWPRFQFTALAGALLTMAIVGAAVAAGWHYLLAQVVATLVAMAATYLVNRRWTFGPTPPPG